MRSTPIRWCANGSAIGYGGLTKRRGKPRTAASTTICATRRTKAKHRRSPTSPRSITPSRTAAARGDTKRRSNEVYRDRICRRLPNRTIEFYAVNRLGAFGSDLAAMSWFFDRPYETPAAALTPVDHSWVLGNASSWLRAQGRLREALPPARATLQREEAANSWNNAAIVASNLSETELLVGEIAAATATAKKAVSLADLSADPFQMLTKRVTHANALHAAGELEIG